MIEITITFLLQVLVNREPVVHFYREHVKIKKKSYWQVAHCILAIYHFTRLRSKYMSCLIVLEISNALSWVLIRWRKHLVVFVLSSILCW